VTNNEARNATGKYHEIMRANNKYTPPIAKPRQPFHCFAAKMAKDSAGCEFHRLTGSDAIVFERIERVAIVTASKVIPAGRTPWKM